MMSAAKQLESFLAKFSPGVRATAKAALQTMRKRLPGAIEFVYDNYYALVIGFGATEHPSDAVFSIVVYPKHVTLCFLFGAELADPERLLQGAGARVRHIRLSDASDLDRPAVASLIEEAARDAPEPFSPRRKASARKLIIRAVSKRQRSRKSEV